MKPPLLPVEPWLRKRLIDLVNEYRMREDASIHEAICSITADLRHLSDRWTIDYAEADRMGYRHYLAELKGE